MKTASLIGDALDWAVAKAEGMTVEIQLPGDCGRPLYVLAAQPGFTPWVWSPSESWHHGGPIIERERICITYPRWDGQATALKIVEEFDDRWEMHGPTPLIAAMRCYIASRLGEEVGIPEELQGVTP